jgi:hypothetical protein
MISVFFSSTRMILSECHESPALVDFASQLTLASEMTKRECDAAAGDRTRVTRVTGGNTYHYTTTTRV